MINIKDVSIIDLSGTPAELNSKWLKRNPNISRKNARIILENELEDLKALKEYYYAHKDEFAKGDKLDEYLKRFEKTDLIYVMNFAEKHYLPNEYSKINFNQKIVDLNSYPSYLLYGSPFELVKKGYYKPLKTKLYVPNIYILKHLLTHCDIDGKNLLAKYCGISDFQEIELLLNAIDLYDKQVAINYSLNNNQECDDLFLLNYLEKEELVRKQLKDIVDYLLSNAYMFVWGTSKKEEDGILRDIVRYHDLTNVFYRKEFIKKIAYYSTLEECQKGLTKTKSLDKFIVK